MRFLSLTLPSKRSVISKKDAEMEKFADWAYGVGHPRIRLDRVWRMGL